MSAQDGVSLPCGLGEGRGGACPHFDAPSPPTPPTHPPTHPPAHPPNHLPPTPNDGAGDLVSGKVTRAELASVVAAALGTPAAADKTFELRRSEAADAQGRGMGERDVQR